MLKIFTTQLLGLFNKIQEREEFNLEDAARLLSQALVGEGTIYMYGEDEMEAIVAEAIYGKERLSQVKRLSEIENMSALHQADRVLLIARSSTAPKVNHYADQLVNNHIPFVAISTIEDGGNSIEDKADVHLDLKVASSLVPIDTGERIGYPASLIALYVYFCLYLLINEMILDYE